MYSLKIARPAKITIIARVANTTITTKTSIVATFAFDKS